jgi:hypothetical protein
MLTKRRIPILLLTAAGFASAAAAQTAPPTSFNAPAVDSVPTLASILLDADGLGNRSTLRLVTAFGNHSWVLGDTRGAGLVDFVTGPPSPPLGIGSLRLFTTNDVADKATLDKREADLGALADFTGSYEWYRDYGPSAVAPALKLGIDTPDPNPTDPQSVARGEDRFDKILIYEPYLNPLGRTLVDDAWDGDVITQTQGDWWIVDLDGSTVPGYGIGGPYLTLDEWLNDANYGTTLNAGTITSIQFGVGSYNPDFNGFVDNFEYTTTYGSYQVNFDPPTGTLILEADPCQDDYDANAGNGYQIAVTLSMEDLPSDVTGFQAFVAYDTGLLQYNGTLSSYTSSPFPLHIGLIGNAEYTAGELELNGSVSYGDPGVNADALLATLVFDVLTECESPVVAFLVGGDFPSELSYLGVPVLTTLVDTDPFKLDDTPPVFTVEPPDVAVECIEDAYPGLPFGETTGGGIAIYYNNNGVGEQPDNQAYLQAQFARGDINTGAPYLFNNDPLTAENPFVTWHQIFSGLTPPDSQFGLDLVWETPTSIGSPPTPNLFAYDHDGVVGQPTTDTVTWALNDYKPHTPSIDAGVVFNSSIRGHEDSDPTTDVEILRNDVTFAGTVFTAVIEGRLTSDGIAHWFTPSTPHSPLSNLGLNGDFYFSGTLTYDVATDTDPLMDYYEGTVDLVANHPSSVVGFAQATDNCADPGDNTTWTVITYSDVLVGDDCSATITRTWTATDPCGNESTHVQTITVLDDVDPTFLYTPADIDMNADAGGCTLTLTEAEIDAPIATDNCIGPVAITWVRSDGALNLDDPFDAADSPITITWTATDDCSNSASHVQTVVVNAVNDVDITVALLGSTAPVTRCIHFVTNDCDEYASVLMNFTDHDGLPGTPVQASATVEVPCGSWSALCVKDEQHTLWSTVGLTDAGTYYTANATVTLEGGDTDDDGDIDINDVTWLLFQWGGGALNGDCPWDGTRDADFNNDTVVNSLDYAFIGGNWLVQTSCACTSVLLNPGDPRFALGTSAVLTRDLPGYVGARVDLNADGIVNVRDVEIFESLHQLDGSLSAAMRQAAQQNHALPTR